MRRTAMLLTVLLAASASAETVVNCTQNNGTPAGAAVPAAVGEIQAAAAAPAAESLFGPANAFTLGAALGVYGVDTYAPRPVVSLLGDLKLLHYLGLEGEVAVGVPAGSRAVPVGGRGFAKVQIPFRSPILDLTPKAGIGYVSGVGSAVIMVGAEVEFFRFLAVLGDLSGSSSDIYYRRVSLGALVRLTPAFRVGARLVVTQADAETGRGYSVMLQYRF